MKKNVIYIGFALIIGLFAGWLFFGNSQSSDTNSTAEAHNHLEEATNQMWTCSMHPQIMQPEPGDCPICGMDLIPAESSSDGLMADQFKLTENAMALANIQTSIVGKGTVEDNVIKLSGKIAENEEANAVQVSYFSGRIERLNISFTGEEVRKGQLLATIYSPELYAAQQELITASSLKASQPALYKAVRNKLKLWKLSENQINQIEESGKVKENFPVYATVSGTVTDKLVEQGDYIKQGQPLLKIANLNTVWANFDVYENQIDVFKKGQEVAVTATAYPNKEFKGKVEFIDPTLNTKTRTVTLRIVLNNQDDVFKPGMFVEGKIKGIASSKKNLLTIPSSAVLWTGERSVVYIKASPDQPIFEMREVVLGNQIGDNYQIMDGLSDGNEIVTNGTFTVDGAAQLQGKKSMMNKSMKDQSMSSMENMKMKLSESFQKEFQTTLTSYLKMKDAFIESDANMVSGFADNMYQKAQSLNTDSFGEMELAHFNKTLEMLKAISENKNIETQRSHFVILNENIVAITMNVDDLKTPLYVQKCPMANNNKGAMWLSAKKEIRNPYYGDAMLTCGEVKQVIE